MKKYLLKSLVFVVLVLILSSIIQLLAPYYWANEGYSAKIRYINETPEQYNTLFFGSSRMYRHIYPIIFDKRSIYPVHSFNVGFAETFVPETYYLLENFLRKTSNEKLAVFPT